MNLPQDISYIPNFIEDDRTLYVQLLEEFFYQGPEPIVFGGSRVGGLAFSNDRSNSYTKSANLDRQCLNKRLWLPMTGLLAGRVAAYTGVNPTVAVFNFYRDGDDFLVPHSDYDYAIGPHVKDVVIAGVSFGVERLFQFLQIGGQTEHTLVVKPGSLLVMRGEVQKHWLHAIPKAENCGARLSVTFLHHQLDPVDQRSWVLAEVPSGFREQLNTDLGDLLRGYGGDPPRPVFIGAREEVFVRWCCMDEPDHYVALEPGSSNFHEFMTLQDMLSQHRDLEDLVPQSSKFPPGKKKRISLDPDALKLEEFETGFLEEMRLRLVDELALRDAENRDPS